MPAPGWRKPDAKTYKLSIPLEDDLRLKLVAAAEKAKTTVSAHARDLLRAAMESVGK